MGYCPFLVLGHDTADCIVTQQGWASAKGRDTTEQGAQQGAATRCSGSAIRPVGRCDTALCTRDTARSTGGMGFCVAIQFFVS